MTLRTLLRDNGGRTPDGKRRLIVVGTLEIEADDLPAGGDFALAGELVDLGDGMFAFPSVIVADVTGQLAAHGMHNIADAFTSGFQPDCSKRVRFGSHNGRT